MDTDKPVENPAEITPGNAARVLSVLLVTAEDDLDGFRTRIMGRENKLTLERLGAMREVLLRLSEVLFRGDDTSWQAVLEARDELARDEELEAVGQVAGPADGATKAPAPPLAATPIPPAGAATPLSTPAPASVDASTSPSAPPPVAPLPLPAVPPPHQAPPPQSPLPGRPPPPPAHAGSPQPPAVASPWAHQATPEGAAATADERVAPSQLTQAFPLKPESVVPVADPVPESTMDQVVPMSQPPEELPFKPGPSKLSLPASTTEAEEEMPDFGSTVSASVMSPFAMAKALPFGPGGDKKDRPAAPPTDLASTKQLQQGAATGEGLPELSVQQYASLCATCQRHPDQLEPTLHQWGIADRETHERLNAMWRSKLDADAVLRQRFDDLVVQYRQWLERLSKPQEGSH